MNISLISMDQFYGSFGLRSLSASLKQAGHDVKLIFMIPTERFEYSEHLSDEILKQLEELVTGSDMIGISCMSNEAKETGLVIAWLKRLNIPIVWGGIHATSCPEKCLTHADIVCVGEGEEALCDLVGRMERGETYFDTPNFWFNNKGEIIKNPPRPLIDDLDALPFPDYEPESHYILEGGTIVKASSWYERVDRMYIHTARGCPNSCNFCCNSFIRDMYAEKGKVIRKMSVDAIIREIKNYRERFPNINFVWFTDDTMFAKSKKELTEFAQRYKNEVNLPFWCFVSPNSITEEKLDMLVDAGLCKIEMGVQSGSENINRNLYNRQISNEQVIKAAEIISKRMGKIVCASYQIIINNPYEAREDILETIRLIISLPTFFRLQVFPLQFFPASGLYDRAVRDGLVKDDTILNLYNHSKAFDQDIPEHYLNYLLCMMKGNVTRDKIGLIPRYMLPALLSKIAISLFSIKPLFRILVNATSDHIDNRTGEISFPDLIYLDA